MFTTKSLPSSENTPTLELLGPVASALARKVSILDGTGRQPDALDVHEDLVCRVGSAAPSYQELIERSLIERAEFHLISGRYRPSDRSGKSCPCPLSSRFIGKPIANSCNSREGEASR